MSQTAEQLRRKVPLELKRKKFNRLMLFIRFVLYRKDGRPTSFATKYGLESAWDLYNFLKEVKRDLKRDREDVAFFHLSEMSKSVYGRATYWLLSTFDEELKGDVFRAGFAAHVFILRTLGFALDNLNFLKVVFKEFEETTFKEEDVTRDEV